MSNFLRNPNLTRNIATVAAGIGALSLSACSTGAQHNFGPKDPSMTCIELLNGANLRTDPHVPNGNDGKFNDITTIRFTDNEDYPTLKSSIPVTDKSGFYISEDPNGVWYGISADILEQYFKNNRVKKRIKSDSDGTVWVNQQRAEVCENPKKPSVVE